MTLKEFLENKTVRIFATILLALVLAVCITLVPAIVDFVQGGDFDIEIGGQREVIVHLDPNGGQLEIDESTVLYEHEYGALPIPKRRGMEFLGWYNDSDVKITNESKVDNMDDHALYAKWGVYVSFDVNNDSNQKIDSQSVVWNDKYGALPTPQKDDATFLGWYTTPAFETQITNNTKVTAEKNHTLYAKWGVTISFDTNGAGVLPSRQVVVGAEYGDLPTLTREDGAEFLGWYTENDGGVKVEPNTKIDKCSNPTIYARWTESTVTFDYNGGSGNVKGKKVVWNSNYGDLPEPTRTNYGFIGWYTSPDGGEKVISTTIYKSTQNTTLYAHWIKTEYLYSNIRTPDTVKIIKEHNSSYYKEKISPNGLSSSKLQELKELGYNNITLHIEFDAKEIDDGWVNIMLYKGTDTTQYIRLTGKFSFDKSCGHYNSSAIYNDNVLVADWPSGNMQTHYFVFNFEITELLNDQGVFTIGFGASGSGDDDWILGSMGVSVLFTK